MIIQLITYWISLKIKILFNLDEKLFESNNLKLEYQDYLHPIYPQRMSQEFIPDLSIIDMMFNIGSDSSKLIKGQISYD